MKVKHLVLAIACAGMLGATAPASTAQAEDSIYVPLFTYRTGPYANSGHSDRQRHARLSQHAQRA